MENKYILQESENKSFWVCTDTKNKIVVVFENGKFNETQKMTALDDFNPKILCKFRSTCVKLEFIYLIIIMKNVFNGNNWNKSRFFANDFKKRHL